MLNKYLVKDLEKAADLLADQGSELFVAVDAVQSIVTEMQQDMARAVDTAREQDEELIALRVSMARVAQVVGLDFSCVGELKVNGDDVYHTLRYKAQTIDRGWNLLAGMIVGAVEGLKNACCTKMAVCNDYSSEEEES